MWHGPKTVMIVCASPTNRSHLRRSPHHRSQSHWQALLQPLITAHIHTHTHTADGNRTDTHVYREHLCQQSQLPSLHFYINSVKFISTFRTSLSHCLWMCFTVTECSRKLYHVLFIHVMGWNTPQWWHTDHGMHILHCSICNCIIFAFFISSHGSERSTSCTCISKFKTITALIANSRTTFLHIWTNSFNDAFEEKNGSWQI